MKEKFLILDNVISKSYLKHLVDNIFDYNWKFSSNLTYGNYGDYEKNNKFCNYEYGFTSELSQNQINFILPLILKICDLCDIEILNKNQISRILPIMQTKVLNTNEINDIHVDQKQNHYVIIFYPHTIDGDTILYDQTIHDVNFSNLNKMNDKKRKELTKNFTILKKITPKENRAVVFNGNRYHASSSPSKGPRCVINFNINCVEIEKQNHLNYQ